MADSGTSHHETINGLRLHYVEWGSPSASPVLLLHGLRAYAHWFDEFADAAADRYRLIGLDWRGRGESEWARDGDYSRRAYVSDLEGVVAALGFERFYLVGHSLGGANATTYIASHPDRVLGFINVDVGPQTDPAGVERIIQEVMTGPQRFDSWDEATAYLEKLHARASARSRETRRQWMLREASDGGIEWRIDPRIYQEAGESSEEAWSNWRKVSCETLIVRGGDSDILTTETCEQMVEAVPSSYWVEVPNAGHMVPEDNPEGFNAVALEFLDRIEGEGK